MDHIENGHFLKAKNSYNTKNNNFYKSHYEIHIWAFVLDSMREKK